MRKPRPALISVTEIASTQIKKLIAERNKNTTLGIRIAVNSKGCSGLSYIFEFCDVKNENDEIVEQDGVKFFIDNKSILFIIGTIIDYENSTFEKGFKFINANEKGRCGCGKSFHI